MRAPFISCLRLGAWYDVPFPASTCIRASLVNLLPKKRSFGSKSQLDGANGVAGLQSSTPRSLKSADLTDTSSELTLPRDGSPLRCTKDQWLYRPTAQEIDLFRNAPSLPTKPIDAEGSVIIRLVDLKEGVTSPVGRSVLYSEYGVRAGECVRIILLGSVCCATFCGLGYWQLRRRDWKTNLLNNRRAALSLPLVKIGSFHTVEGTLSGEGAIKSPVEYRSVECTGVLDTSCQLLVGPRSSLYHTYGESAGYHVVYPLRFRDGSCVLVNMGWLGSDDVLNDISFPELVTLRGILVTGDITESLLGGLKVKTIDGYQSMMSRLFGMSFPPASTRINRPSRLVRNDSRKVYRYLDPASMSQETHSASPLMTGRYAVNVYDVLYHDDIASSPLVDNAPRGSAPTDGHESHFLPKSNIGRAICSTRGAYQRRQKSDYLLFYADPDTHFNYAAQWFLMAASIAGMCVYKLIRVRRTLKVAI